MDIEGIDKLDESYVLIDDNKMNILDWNNCGGIGILFKRILDSSLPYQMQEMNVLEFYKCLDFKNKYMIKRK